MNASSASALGQAHDRGDLGVRAALELAHDERRALCRGDVPQRTQDVRDTRIAVLGRGRGELLVELDLLALLLVVAEVPADLVVRDRQQPVLGLPGLRPLCHRAVGVQERLLGDVLGVSVIADDREGVAVHRGHVAPVEPVEGRCSRRAEQCGRHHLESCAIGRIRNRRLRKIYEQTRGFAGGSGSTPRNLETNCSIPTDNQRRSIR
jgi:hypothetical protein